VTAALILEADDRFRHRRRRQLLPFWAGPAVLGAIMVGSALLLFLDAPAMRQGAAESRIINVILPPPPPPPPPPPREKPPEPEKPMPLDQPKPSPETPPPPAPPAPAQGQPAQGENALTAREGPAAGNFGLVAGDGSGTRIGGKPGGGPGLGAYGMMIAAEIQRACSRDASVASGRYAAQLLVRVAEDGRIVEARFTQGSGSDRRDRAISACVSGHQLSQRPPAGLPPVRVEFSSRSGL
jgi:outer membrane biosynthesis protein TonB